MRAMNKELILVLMFYQASADELLHHVCGKSACLILLLQLQDLLSEFLDLPIPYKVFSYLSICFLLISSDLSHGPSALTGNLQHIG